MTKVPHYEFLPQELKYRLHSLELREAYSKLKEITLSKNVAFTLLNQHVFGADFHEWRDQVHRFVNSTRKRQELVPYYLVAGCGIMKMCKLLKVGPDRVYKVRNTLTAYNRPQPLAGAFDKDAINNLQHLLSMLQVMDGFRIMEPERERHNPFVSMMKKNFETEDGER